MTWPSTKGVLVLTWQNILFTFGCPGVISEQKEFAKLLNSRENTIAVKKHGDKFSICVSTATQEETITVGKTRMKKHYMKKIKDQSSPDVVFKQCFGKKGEERFVKERRLENANVIFSSE